MPKPKTIYVTNDQSVCGSKKVLETGIGKEKGVGGAVVFIQGPVPGGKRLSLPSLVIDQRGCEFVPHTLLVPVGIPVTVQNSDATLHNFHTAGKVNPPTNRAQSGGSAPIPFVFQKPEIFSVGCDVHPWMQAWIVVAEHAYYALSNEEGNFSMADIPAGAYTLKLWHEFLGEQQKKVTVREGETTSVEYILELKN
ncbi:MAG: hypothetical protein HYS22_01595 [Deltaproteobacteria bacterium]|nr:hypothetical protein [Deltaproteobacteria bacterium]